MKIAVDIDGVLLDSMKLFCDIHNEKFHSNYSKSEITTWEFFREWGIKEHVFYEILHKIFKTKNRVPLEDESAPECMRSLNKMHNVHIVSARNSELGRYAIKTLNEYHIRRGIEYDDILFVEEKPYDIKLNYSYDLYIDDNPNLVEPIKQMKDKILLLFDQPWNNKTICEKNVKRVRSWQEIMRIVIKLFT